MRASRPQRWKRRAIAALLWFHRWIGVATCLIFALWFASGAVMLFQPFPSLPRAGRMALQETVDLSTVAIAPARAIAAAGHPVSALRLVQRGDVPAYIAETAEGLSAVDARTAAVLPPVGRAAATATAHRLLGPEAHVVGPFGYDQWIVHDRFDPWRPFYRLDSGAGTELYLSARTGEIVQRTSRSERAWNWVGSVLHWVYFTPLRSSFTAWDSTVWLLSLVAMLVAIAGTILGVLRTVAAQRLARPALSFFRGKWMRWHHILGLFVSPVVLIWIFSGWLSMDHGRLFARGQATAAERAAFHGLSPGRSVSGVAAATLRTLPAAAEIAFDAVGGDPVILLSDHRGATRPFDRRARPIAPERLIASAKRGVAAAWPRARVDKVRAVEATNVLALAEGWPRSVVAFIPAGEDAPSIYIDGSNGRLLTVMTASRATYAWLYYALHTFNFPELAARPFLRRTIVLSLMLIGLAFSMTGVVLGVKRLRRLASQGGGRAISA